MDLTKVDWWVVAEISTPVITAAGGFGAAMFHRHVIKPLKAIGAASVAFPTLSKDVVTLKEVIAEVSKQMTLNGGSTLRDEIQAMRLEQIVQGGSLDQLMAYIETPIYRTDPEGRWTRCNDALVALVGWSPEDLTQMGWVNIIVESDRQRVIDALEFARKDRRRYSVKAKLESRAGVRLDVTLTGHPKADGSSGRVLAWYGSIVTERAA
jgi:PAS domain S-box-containing protein